MPLPVLRGICISLRPAVSADDDRFREIISTPEVSKWWKRYELDLTSVSSETGATSDGEFSFAIEFEGAVVGLIQFYEEEEPDYRHAGIDIFVDPDFHGRGIGRDAVRTLASYLLTERGHHRLVIDPAVSNTRAIKTYAKVGFKPVGVMRQYERGRDGSWHDGLLMDLLPEDLEPFPS